MKSLSVDIHDHDPAYDDELYDLLKGMGDTKVAAKQPKASDSDQDPGESPGEGSNVQGVNPDQSEVEDRPKGSIDAPWGEESAKGVLQFSQEASRQFRKNREDLLGKLLDGKHTNEKEERSCMGKHLKHVATGDFESGSPTLGQKVASQTLLERVRRLTGQR